MGSGTCSSEGVSEELLEYSMERGGYRAERAFKRATSSSYRCRSCPEAPPSAIGIGGKGNFLVGSIPLGALYCSGEA